MKGALREGDMETIALQNDTLRLDFNRQNGALCSLESVTTGWKMMDRPELGLSFRLLIPLSEERRNNAVYGEKQLLSEVTLSPDGKSVSFVWDQPISEVGGELDIRIQLDVRLDGAGAIFNMEISNHSPYIVENVYCPYLGDIQPPAQAEWFKTFLYNYASA